MNHIKTSPNGHGRKGELLEEKADGARPQAARGYLEVRWQSPVEEIPILEIDPQGVEILSIHLCQSGDEILEIGVDAGGNR